MGPTIPVRLAGRRVWVGDESRLLLSGEIHYWRLDRTRWRSALEATRHIGLDIVSTYVPWNVHVPERGQGDFGSVLAFIELAQELGFWVLARPGPYIYAEWPNSGIPDRV